MSSPSHLASPRWLVLLVCLSGGLSTPMDARPPGPPGGKDDQVRATIREADEIAHPDKASESRNLQRRDDLERDFAQIAGKAADSVYFYYGGDSDAVAASADSIWALSLERVKPQLYGLYMFDSSEEPEQSAGEFNRLISHLNLSIPDERAAGVARFFLDCCVRGAPGQVADTEDGLQHAVERYYMQAYGDVWRSLEAHTEWEEGYQAASLPTPTVVVESGGTRITLKRLVLRFGMHPQLEQWDLEVMHDGTVRVLAVEPVYPKESRWLSYDFRATMPLGTHQSYFEGP